DVHIGVGRVVGVAAILDDQGTVDDGIVFLAGPRAKSVEGLAAGILFAHVVHSCLKEAKAACLYTFPTRQMAASPRLPAIGEARMTLLPAAARNKTAVRANSCVRINSLGNNGRRCRRGLLTIQTRNH